MFLREPQLPKNNRKNNRRIQAKDHGWYAGTVTSSCGGAAAARGRQNFGASTRIRTDGLA